MDNSCFGHGRPNGQGAEAPIPGNARLGGRVPKGAEYSSSGGVLRGIHVRP